MVSIDTNIHRMMSGSDESRKLLLLHSMHASPLRRNPAEMVYPSVQHQPQRVQQQNHASKRSTYAGQSGPSTAVSRRNARERKRVRLVNLGFSTLRERVPPGSKNKKLSKVETLRAAIEYIRQLQDMLGMPDQQLFDESHYSMLADHENYVADDCSSVASSEEVGTPPLRGSCGTSGGSGDLSPSNPSDYSSPYTSHTSQDEQLLDMGIWFS